MYSWENTHSFEVFPKALSLYICLKTSGMHLRHWLLKLLVLIWGEEQASRALELSPRSCTGTAVGQSCSVVSGTLSNRLSPGTDIGERGNAHETPKTHLLFLPVFQKSRRNSSLSPLWLFLRLFLNNVFVMFVDNPVKTSSNGEGEAGGSWSPAAYTEKPSTWLLNKPSTQTYDALFCFPRVRRTWVYVLLSISEAVLSLLGPLIIIVLIFIYCAHMCHSAFVVKR